MTVHQIFGPDIDIYVSENFLSASELELLDTEIDKANKENLWLGEDGNSKQTGTWEGRNLFIGGVPQMGEIFERIKKEYTSYILKNSVSNEEEVFGGGLGPINRTLEGQGLAVHDDVGPPELNRPVAYGVVLYLNDDFSGGELYYPELNLEIKPKPGLLVIHPASSKYRHGVKPVTKGVRYGLTMFINRSNVYY